MNLSRPELTAARDMLVNCHRHTNADLDAAAAKLASSPRASDTRLATLWEDMRATEGEMRA